MDFLRVRLRLRRLRVRTRGRFRVALFLRGVLGRGFLGCGVYL